ncbi:uncharacterized protein [Anabrus simplex]|uniref:uncharacterized protein n=1 Tax=Anabrus simplex TaxID=316456 RepID=UPI0034DD494E
MALKLDDLLTKKKEAPQVLDLSRSVVQSKEEFRKLLDRCPEYKIRPEKVRPEDIKLKEKEFTFRPQKRELKHQGDYSYGNPIPPDMRSVALEDLSSVPIDWKMLTSIRPRLKMEEEMFSKLVMMGKLHLHAAAQESRDGGTTNIRKSKNRAGIIETRAVICPECAEEFCSGMNCSEFLYDNFLRGDEIRVNIESLNGEASSEKNKNNKKKPKPKKKRAKSGKKKKGKKKSKKKSDSEENS